MYFLFCFRSHNIGTGIYFIRKSLALWRIGLPLQCPYIGKIHTLLDVSSWRLRQFTGYDFLVSLTINRFYIVLSRKTVCCLTKKMTVFQSNISFVFHDLSEQTQLLTRRGNFSFLISISHCECTTPFTPTSILLFYVKCKRAFSWKFNFYFLLSYMLSETWHANYVLWRIIYSRCSLSNPYSFTLFASCCAFFFRRQALKRRHIKIYSHKEYYWKKLVDIS